MKNQINHVNRLPLRSLTVAMSLWLGLSMNTGCMMGGDDSQGTQECNTPSLDSMEQIIEAIQDESITDSVLLPMMIEKMGIWNMDEEYRNQNPYQDCNILGHIVLYRDGEFLNNFIKLLRDALLVKNEEEKVNKFIKQYINRHMGHTRRTALHLAMLRKNVGDLYKILEVLLENGADPHIGSHSRKTVVHYLAFIRDQSVDFFTTLLGLFKQYNANLNITDFDRKTPLVSAVEWGNLELFQALASEQVGGLPENLFYHLVRGKSNELDKGNCSKEFFKKILQSRYKILDFIIREYDDDFKVFKKNNKTILHLAVENKYIDICKLLLKHIDGNSQDEDGRTIVHRMAISVHKDLTVKEFIELFKGYPINFDTPDKEGITPIMLAAQRANVEVFKYLLEERVDLTRVDHSNRNIYHHIVISKPEGLFNKYYNKRYTYGTCYGITYQSLKNKIKLFEPLIEPLKQQIRDKAQGVCDILNKPLIQNQKPIYDSIIKHIIQNETADINHRDNCGDTPLSLTGKKKFNQVYNHISSSFTLTDINEELAQQLIAHGGDLSIKNNKGQTAYDQAIENEYFTIATILKPTELP